MSSPRRYFPPRPAAGNTKPTDWLYGVHAVKAALENPARRVRRWVMTASLEATARDWTINAAVVPEMVDRIVIERLLPPGAVHQGAALLADLLPNPDLRDFIADCAANALVVVLDQVTDPHNIGAILRSAAAFGATALIIDERATPALTGALAKAASGAVERVTACRLPNLARALRQLKEGGFWRVGLVEDGAILSPIALAEARLALVFGAEGDGLRRLTREHCDALMRLPTQADFSTLNVSNAAAVALYAACLARPGMEQS